MPIQFPISNSDVYPCRQEFYTIAPAKMETKLRGPIEKFNERWLRVGQGLPMNPEKAKKGKTEPEESNDTTDRISD